MERILVARAPVRIIFGGGGTDLGGYYERYGGSIIGAAISYYVYAILASNQRDGVQVIYAGHQSLSHHSDCEDLTWDSKLGVPTAIAHHFNVRDGLTIFVASQVPLGAGLGLPGSVAVSMIKALAFCSGLDLEPREVAELAHYIESEKLKLPIGKQDQYMAAFGGLNSVTFSKRDVLVEPLHLSPETRRALERGLMLFLVDNCRETPVPLRRERRAGQPRDMEAVHSLTMLNELTLDIHTALEQGDLETFGELLHRCWISQSSLATDSAIAFLSECYELARENGALGGRISGTGVSSFLILYCPEERQQVVTETLSALGLQRWPLTLEDQGVQVMQAVPWSRPAMMSAMPWSQPPLQQRVSPASQGIG